MNSPKDKICEGLLLYTPPDTYLNTCQTHTYTQNDGTIWGVTILEYLAFCTIIYSGPGAQLSYFRPLPWSSENPFLPICLLKNDHQPTDLGVAFL